MAQEILVSINVNSGKAQAGLESTRKSVSKLESAQEKLNYELSEEAKELAKVNALIAANRAANNRAAFASKEYGDAIQKAQKNTKNYRTQAGLNNAILLETGRLASDASFGFTAIANNLSQLVSLGGSFVATTGSVSTALGELRKSLFGVGGLLLGFQILIGLLQSKRFLEFIRTLGGVTAAMKALNEATKEATGVYGKQIGKLETLARLLEDDNVTQEQRVMILAEVKEENEDLNLQLDDQNKLTEESVKQIQARIDVLKVQAETQALISAIEKERVKQIEAENKSVAESVDFYDSIILLLKNFNNVQQAAIEGVAKGEENRREEIGKSQKIIDKLYERLAQVVNFDVKDDPSGRKRKFREFEEGLFNIQNIINKYNEQADKINVRSLEERLELEEEYAKRDADSKLANFEEAQAKRLEEYKERVKGAKNANELIANAERDFQSSVEDARRKHGEALLSIEQGFIAKRILEKDKEAQAIGKIERKIEDAEISRLKFSIGANSEYFAAKAEQVSEDKLQVDAQIANAEALKLSDLEVAELKLQSFNLQNQAIDLNLQKEIAAISEKERVNSEYVGFVKGISQLLSTLAGENEGLQKAALILEKGAAIADIVIKTQAANQASIALDTSTAGATIPVTAPLRLRNNIGAGISIANILATTLTSFKKPSASGGGGAAPASVQAPAFNVVGASSTDQLAQAVAGQVQQPVRAFVVGAEITEQQALDRKIIETAGL